MKTFCSFINKTLPFILMTVTIFCVFRKTFLSGLLPIPGDILIGAYYPWLDSKWGYSVGVPIKNPMPSDVVSIMYPWRFLGISMLKSGEFPLWDKTSLLGTPLLANFQSAILNPLNILFFFLSFPVSWSIQVILQPILISLFTYLFLRQIRLSKKSAIFGSLIFSFSGFSLVWMEYNTIGYTLAFLALIFLFSHKIVEQGRIKDSFLLALAVCLQIFSGYPQIAIYTLIFSSVYFSYQLLINKQAIFRKVIIYLIGITSGLLLTAIQLLPSLELMKLSIRATDNVAAAGGIQFLPLKHFLTFFIPNFFGNPATGNYWGNGSYDNFSFYIPSVGIPFFLLSILLKSGLKRDRFIFLLLAAFSLLIALNTPIGHFITNSSFLGMKSAVSTRAFSIFDFTCAIMAAIGIEDLLSKRRIRIFYLLFPLLICLGLLLGILTVNVIYKQAIINPTVYADIKQYTNLQQIMTVIMRNSVIPFLFIGTVSCVSIIFRAFPRSLFIMIFLLLTLDIIIATNKYLTFFPKHLLYPQVEVLSDLKNELGNDRFDREQAELLPSNTWVPYGLNAVSGQNPIYPKSSATLFGIADNSYPNPAGRFVNINLNSPLLDIFNIKYLLVLNRHPEKAFPTPEGEPFNKFKNGKFSEYKNYKTVRILKNDSNLGPAWFSKNVVCRQIEAKTAAILSDKNYLPKELVVINCPENNNIYNALVGSALLQTELSNTVRIKVETPVPNYLIVSRAYFPGWEVYLDGIKQRLFIANIALMATFIPSGNHTVTLKYNPLSFRLGALISALNLLFWGGYFCYSTRKSRQKAVCQN